MTDISEYSKKLLDVTIIEALAIRVEQRPDEVAITSSSGDTATNLELSNTANAMAAALVEVGVTPGDHVVAVVGRTVPGVAAFFGIWQAGAMFCPLDPFMPPEFLKTCCDLLHPKLCLVDDTLLNANEIKSHAKAWGLSVIDLSNLSVSNAAPVSHRLLSNDAPATCVCTSGSTGVPKGVVHSIKTLTAGLKNQAQTLQLNENDVSANALPFSHVHGLGPPLLSTLLSGGQIGLFENPFKASDFFDFLNQIQATFFTVIPMHYKLIVDEGDALVGRMPASVTRCRSASAPLSEDIWRQFEALHNIPLMNTLGMSETNGQIFYARRDIIGEQFDAIGKPHAFDIELRSVGVGMGSNTGEACIRGAAMMLGYIGDDGVLSSPLDKDGWLATGDIMAVDEAGVYRIVGRTKDIAIFCGINISLLRIEQLLEADPDVDGVIAKRDPHDTLGEVISLYVQANNTELSEERGRELMALAATMTPSRLAINKLIYVANLPQTGIGKKDRNADIAADAMLLDVGFTRWQSAEDILSDILKLPIEEITDDLSAGMCRTWDSLAQVNIAIAIEERLERKLTPSELPMLENVASIKRVIDGHMATPQIIPSASSEEEQALTQFMSLLIDAGYGTTTMNHVMVSWDFLKSKGIVHADRIVEALIGHLPADGHLVMNAFTWSFCQGTPFDLANTPGEVGLINEVFRRWPSVRRSTNPIYSYAVYGPDAEELAKDDAPTCWGEGSLTLKMLRDENMRNYTIGLGPLPGQHPSLLRAYPGLHAIEEILDVPYRFQKAFTGMCRFDGEWHEHSIDMFCRDMELDMRNDWRPLNAALEKMPDTVVSHQDGLLAYRASDLVPLAEAILTEDLMGLAKKS